MTVHLSFSLLQTHEKSGESARFPVSFLSPSFGRTSRECKRSHCCGKADGRHFFARGVKGIAQCLNIVPMKLAEYLKNQKINQGILIISIVRTTLISFSRMVLSLSSTTTIKRVRVLVINPYLKFKAGQLAVAITVHNTSSVHFLRLRHIEQSQVELTGPSARRRLHYSSLENLALANQPGRGHTHTH